MIEVILKRKYLISRTIGEFTVFHDDKEVGRFYSLELPWKYNKRNISCISEGEYICIPFNSTLHPNTYKVLDVNDRDDILIHIGNYIKDSRGCILLGLDLRDLNNDGLQEVIKSRLSLFNLNRLIGDNNFKLIIK